MAMIMMRPDIENKMKEDVNTFQELGNLIGLCLDNFENVILPQLPRSKVKIVSNDVEPKKNLPKSILAINFEESSDEKKFLKDFARAKTGKEVNFGNLFDDCLRNYKAPDPRTKSKEMKEETLKSSPENLHEVKKSEGRKSLSKRVLEKNFRLHLMNRKADGEKVDEEVGEEKEGRVTSLGFTQHFQNKQHKTDHKNKDVAVNSKKENTIKNREPRLGSAKKQLERSQSKKRLLGQ